jgi:hypothetical protein
LLPSSGWTWSWRCGSILWPMSIERTRWSEECWRSGCFFNTIGYTMESIWTILFWKSTGIRNWLNSGFHHCCTQLSFRSRSRSSACTISFRNDIWLICTSSCVGIHSSVLDLCSLFYVGCLTFPWLPTGMRTFRYWGYDRVLDRQQAITNSKPLFEAG